MTVDYRRFDVPVDGGALTVGQWGRGGRLVLASHGITANHLSWQRVGELLTSGPEGSDHPMTLVAVDHRGRAGSADTPGPYGLARHADDLIAVLDHLDGPAATLVGHSMGAFVAALAAERHPERVDRLILVDGGLPLPVDLPPGADVEAVIRSVIGPALDRLDQRWPDVEAYVRFFTEHPAFQPPNEWPAAADAYVRHDAVVTADGDIRSSVMKPAVLEDGGAAIVDPDASSAVQRITTPTTLLWAPRGVLDQSPGLYTADQVEAAVAALAHLEAELVADTNHYTVAVGENGASAVAEAIVGS